MQGVESIHADTALKTGAGQLPKPALHFVLQHQVFRAFGNVQKAVDALINIRRPGGAQFRVALRQVVGFGHRIDGGAYYRVIHRFGDTFTEQVNVQVAAADAFDVFVAGSDHGLVTALAGLLGHIGYISCGFDSGDLIWILARRYRPLRALRR